jgi:hypothetical protein
MDPRGEKHFKYVFTPTMKSIISDFVVGLLVFSYGNIMNNSKVKDSRITDFLYTRAIVIALRVYVLLPLNKIIVLLCE